MKKPTKFLIIASEDVEYVLDNVDIDPATRDRIDGVGCDHLKVIECKHENPRDNYVTVTDINDRCSEWTFIQDVNGRLHYFEDIWTKTEVINAFE